MISQEEMERDWVWMTYIALGVVAVALIACGALSMFVVLKFGGWL